MDFMQRLAATYLGFLITIPSIAWWMQANGADYPGNPAWGLISTLRNIVLGSVAILMAGAAVMLIAEIKGDQARETERKEEEAMEQSRAKAASERYEKKLAVEAREDAERKERQRLEKAKVMRARQEAMERELEEKRNRTS